MPEPLPRWEKRDNFRRTPHQAIVDAVNSLANLVPGGNLEIRRTPHGSAIVDLALPGIRTPVVRFKVTEVLSPTALPWLTKAQPWDGTSFIGDEVVIRTHRRIWAPDDELLAVIPLGGVTKIYASEALDADGNPVIWEEVGPEVGLLLVYVTIDGGVAGDSATTCTTTYLAKDKPGGTTLGDTLTPDAPDRYANCEYLQVAADSPAIGYYDSSGTFKLMFVPGEIPKGDVVTVQTTYRIDTATQKFQKKSRDVLVLETTDETDWVDVHTGDVCS